VVLQLDGTAKSGVDRIVDVDAEVGTSLLEKSVSTHVPAVAISTGKGIFLFDEPITVSLAAPYVDTMGSPGISGGSFAVVVYKRETPVAHSHVTLMQRVKKCPSSTDNSQPSVLDYLLSGTVEVLSASSPHASTSTGNDEFYSFECGDFEFWGEKVSLDLTDLAGVEGVLRVTVYDLGPEDLDHDTKNADETIHVSYSSLLPLSERLIYR
jgi:hypothetical protein